LTRNVPGNILRRYSDAGTSLSGSIVCDHNRRRDLGEEKNVRLFRNQGKAAKKGHIGALFVDLDKRTTQFGSLQKGVYLLGFLNSGHLARG